MEASEIAQMLVDMDEDAIAETKKWVEGGREPEEVLRQGVIRGLEMIGEKFEAKEYFLAELMMGGQIAEQCIEIIDPYLPESEGPAEGVVVIGAVQGDLHDIGYGLVAKQLELAGFEVHAMGVNNPAMDFIDKAQAVNANIIGLSAFLVTTIPNCRDTVDYVRDMGLADQFKVIVGGAETDQEKANALEADGWAPNAVEAIGLCKRIVEEQRAQKSASA